MANHRDCPLCGEILEDAPAIHDVGKCENTELLKGRDKIKKLQTSLHEWKYGTGGWFELRDIIGNLWWHHPAIDNDDARAYYRSMLKMKTSIEVVVDGRVVGSVTSPEAAEAVRRLMAIKTK